MLHRLLAILIIGALLLQSGREALIGLWYLANRVQVAERHCVNKDEPLMMCQGKCYLRKVIEAEGQDESPAAPKIPVPEERMPFHALPAPRPLQVNFSPNLLAGQAGFHYQAPSSAEVPSLIFRPPRGAKSSPFF